MNAQETLDLQLRLLGDAIDVRESFVDDVMSQVMYVHDSSPTKVKTNQPTAFRNRLIYLAFAACFIALVSLVGMPFYDTTDSSNVAWWLTSAYGQELVQAVDESLTQGVVAREQFTFLMPDGSFHVSSTYSKFFLTSDRYRRDVFDNNQLRETQWYVPRDDMIVQTSIRYDTKTYMVIEHPSSASAEDRVKHLRSIVQQASHDNQHLEPLEIEGKKCIGFEIVDRKANRTEGSEKRQIWFDAETKLPALIKVNWPKPEGSSSSIEVSTMTLDRFDWNPQLPANTFLPAIPKGFAKATLSDN